MTGELKDAHTRVHSPEQLRDQREYRSSTQGFSVREIGDGLYVRSAGGPDRPWYRSALGAGAGIVRAGGIEV